MSEKKYFKINTNKTAIQFNEKMALDKKIDPMKNRHCRLVINYRKNNKNIKVWCKYCKKEFVLSLEDLRKKDIFLEGHLFKLNKITFSAKCTKGTMTYLTSSARIINMIPEDMRKTR